YDRGGKLMTSSAELGIISAERWFTLSSSPDFSAPCFMGIKVEPSREDEHREMRLQMARAVVMLHVGVSVVADKYGLSAPGKLLQDLIIRPAFGIWHNSERRNRRYVCYSAGKANSAYISAFHGIVRRQNDEVERPFRLLGLVGLTMDETSAGTWLHGI